MDFRGKQKNTECYDARVIGNRVMILSSDGDNLSNFGDPVRSSITTDNGPSIGWGIPLSESAPEVLAALLSKSITSRVALLADFIDEVCSAAALGSIIPILEGNKIRIIATSPSVSFSSQAFIDALSVFGDDSVAVRLSVMSLAARVSGRWTPETRKIKKSDIPKFSEWSDSAKGRLTTGTKISIRVTSPCPSSSSWQVEPVLVSTNDEETMGGIEKVLESGDFNCSLYDMEKFIASEMDRIITISGYQFSKVAENISKEEATQVLSLWEKLEAAGISIIAPLDTIKPSSATATLRAEGSPSSLTSSGLSLTAEVEVIDSNGSVFRLTEEEIEQLNDGKSTLVFTNGRWIRIDPSSAGEVSKVISQVKKKASAADLLYLDDIDVSGVDGWVGDALSNKPWTAARACEASPSFNGTLRPYQKEGLGWIKWLEETGLGGILADDMGLGKTATTLARIDEDHTGPTLIVCPATIVENWKRESEKFVPELKVAKVHGPNRGDILEIASKNDIVITTYGVLRREKSIQDAQWHRVVFDEAQNLKNPATAAARAARSVKADHRLALSGTPVENNLGDLWSIVQVVEPGLLGSRRNFSSKFISEELNPKELENLKKIISPVVLRRTKRDPGVVDDLPERIDNQIDCALTPEQVSLYEATTNSLLKVANEMEGIRRHGNVLAALTRLKQICAHPGLVVKGNQVEGRSGKFDKLTLLLEGLVSQGDAVIVFTQFAQFVPTMAESLSASLKRPVLHFSGDTPLKARQEAVDKFSDPSGPPVILISLKAGGVGLNLVRANHVIHYDQWWNPAVMDQASDRAWRIGQKKTVLVHNLVCPGTLEDRINTIVSSKRKLANQVTGSTSLASLDTEALRDIVVLARNNILKEVG